MDQSRARRLFLRERKYLHKIHKTNKVDLPKASKVRLKTFLYLLHFIAKKGIIPITKAVFSELKSEGLLKQLVKIAKKKQLLSLVLNPLKARSFLMPFVHLLPSLLRPLFHGNKAQ